MTGTISELHGKVAHSGDTYVIIEVCGIGYSVTMTAPAIREISRKEGIVGVYTHLVVREDSLALYGFLLQSEREMFQMLISVTRVGPAMAMSILSQISIPEFAAAILGENEEALIRISGIGRKNAKRLILELRDKMKNRAGDYVTSSGTRGSAAKEDAISALIALGFSLREAKQAVDEAEGTISGEMDVQVLIKAALFRLKER